MAEPARKPATFAELEALPSNVIGQILDGELIALPRPASRHARASSVLGARLGGPFDHGPGGPGGWILLDEPELHLGQDVVVPDLAGWRRSRMPELPSVAAFTLAPDWVCEVLSPSTRSLDRVKKSRIYARERIEWYWMIDPDAQSLEVLHLEGDHYDTKDAFDARVTLEVRAEPFDAVPLELGALFR